MPGVPNSENWAWVSSSPRNCPAVELEDEDDEIPVVLTPVRTTRPLLSTTMVQEEKEKDKEENCVTPKSEDCVLRPNLVCPPAPRKLRPRKRKFGGTPVRKFFRVRDDLELVFRALQDQPKKKIRVGRSLLHS